MKEKEKQTIISVIIPCYNQAGYLPETLESLFQQTYPYWEAIIVNDGSPDDTEKIALEYVGKDQRVHYVYKENGGLSSARNKGIECARGEFILPLDADDIIKPEYIEKALKAFEQNPQIKLVYCQAVFFGEIEGKCDLVYQGYKNLLVGNAIFCSSIYRKVDYLKVGGYDENMRSGYEDWEFYIRLLDEDSIVFQIPLPLFNYRIKANSMSASANQKDARFKTQYYIYTKQLAIYSAYFNGVLDSLQELTYLKKKRERYNNKWYRRFYHKYIKK